MWRFSCFLTFFNEAVLKHLKPEIRYEADPGPHMKVDQTRPDLPVAVLLISFLLLLLLLSLLHRHIFIH